MMRKMMKRSTNTLASAVLASALVPCMAYAQDDVTPSTQKTITPYGLVGSYTFLTESTGDNPLDFLAIYARPGFLISEGIAVGRMELDATGERVGVRHANLGLKLDSGTEVRFGRLRIGGAQGYGADASYVPPQFSSMDGVSVTQGLEFGEGISLSAGLAVTNALLSLNQTEQAWGPRFNPAGELTGYSNRKFGQQSGKTDRALTFSLTANVKGVDFVAFHGMENNQFLSDEIKATTPGGTDIPRKVADASHSEVSLGYSGIDGISFGGWYVNYSQGKAKNVDKNEGGKLTTTEVGTRSYGMDIYGLGVMGDSTLFGMSDFLQKGDKLIYSASVAQTSFGVDGPGAGDVADAASGATFSGLASDSSTQQFVVGAGYAVGGFSAELNVAQEESDGASLFSNSKSEAAQSKGRTSVYVATYFAF